MATLSIRIDLRAGGRLGPGKIRLLQAVGAHGSISAAGRELDMSYRRAWLLIAELNASFSRPVVETAVGGSRGGGAALTPFGREVVAAYEAVERLSAASSRAALAFLDEEASDPPDS